MDTCESSVFAERMEVDLLCSRPRLESWPTVGAGLRQAAEALKRMSVLDIVSALDRVACLWTNRLWPFRCATRDTIVRVTGLSPEIVDHSFDLEMRNYRRESLLAALRREFGEPEVLDSFRKTSELDGFSFAMGPRITLCVFTGNVPGLPALDIVRSLLVKSAVLAKVASGEPIFASRFVESLAEIEPRLGRAILVTYWSRKEDVVLQSAIAQADAVVVYGGQDACAHLREIVPRHKTYVEHGHRLSFGVVSKPYLSRLGVKGLVALIADDVVAFDQHACIAPQAYLIEGTYADLEEIGAALANRLSSIERDLPTSRIGLSSAAVLQMRRATQYFGSDSPRRIWEGTGLGWTVALDDTLLDGFAAGHRFIRLVAVPTLEAAVDMLRPLAGLLQNVALGVEGEALAHIFLEIARLGVSRICEPGRMAEPSLMWRHDGRPCLSTLVGWCDIEMHSGTGMLTHMGTTQTLGAFETD